MSTTFASLGVPENLVAPLDAAGIETPFPIQAATIPDALAGRDLCGKAATGSGKTIAFGVPLLARVHRAAPKRPKGLVLVPTRELAVQVADELHRLSGDVRGPRRLRRRRARAADQEAPPGRRHRGRLSRAGSPT